MSANSRREISKIINFINDLRPDETSPSQLDTYYPLVNFTYRGWVVEISRTPNMMRSGCGMQDYTVNIHR